MARITITKSKNGSMKIKATGLKSPSLEKALKTVAAVTSPLLPLFEKQPETKEK